MREPRPDSPLGRALAAALADGTATAGPAPQLLLDPPPPACSEEALIHAVAELARRHGWLVAHFAPARVTRDGRETYETAARFDGRGFPDLVLARAGTVLLAELKARRGVLRPDQRRWVREAGASVWRPTDWQLIVTTLEGGSS